jgi:hypothetical protein
MAFIASITKISMNSKYRSHVPGLLEITTLPVSGILRIYKSPRNQNDNLQVEEMLIRFICLPDFKAGLLIVKRIGKFVSDNLIRCLKKRTTPGVVKVNTSWFNTHVSVVRGPRISSI